ncbi:hypothetical protein G6047_09340 [Flavobacterium sp. SE-s28]|uniref:Uncharacterized protein n=1 Tax=Flavobacterium silvaticum TaxID=1852020 RepID=A0A972FV79_9FLAO|nr:hypothetical protein [Flavobacterium silvaticum]
MRSNENHSNQNHENRTSPAQLQISQTQFFSYALPPGWRVGEDGQFALTLLAPDNQALTILVGNSGLMPNTNPAQFVYQKLSAMQVQNLQLGQMQQINPINGFKQAYAMELHYQSNGNSYRGVATAQIIPYYDGCVMAMTAAISESSQWAEYSQWLPQVSQQVSATNGAAFGMRGLMQQNLRNSMAYADAAKQYRDWSQKNWQQVTDDKNAVTDRQNTEFRENLGAVQTYDNPNSSTPTVELSTKYQYYWSNKQGQILGTNDASANPNHGDTGDWSPLQKTKH